MAGPSAASAEFADAFMARRLTSAATAAAEDRLARYAVRGGMVAGHGPTRTAVFMHPARWLRPWLQIPNAHVYRKSDMQEAERRSGSSKYGA